MVEEIKKTRVQIDGLYQLTKSLKPLPVRIHDYSDNTFTVVDSEGNSKEIEESAKSLLLAKAWLGKALGELGSESPYSDGKKTVEDIEPAADTQDVFYITVDDGKAGYWIVQNGKELSNHIEKVDWLRSEIQKVIAIVLELNGGKLNKPSFSEHEEKVQWASYQHLCEAKMWLGFEFARIKTNRE